MTSKKAPADVFIQWKGTGVCLDFHCYECNTFAHYDGDFAYVLECPHCKQRYEMPHTVPLKKTERDTCVQHPDGGTQDLKECGHEPGLENEVEFPS